MMCIKYSRSYPETMYDGDDGTRWFAFST